MRGFSDFFMQFPTYYTHLNLPLGHDFHWHRDIEANDLNDVMTLAVAIPYTDVVVTEEFFAGIAAHQDISNRFTLLSVPTSRTYPKRIGIRPGMNARHDHEIQSRPCTYSSSHRSNVRLILSIAYVINAVSSVTIVYSTRNGSESVTGITP